MRITASSSDIAAPSGPVPSSSRPPVPSLTGWPGSEIMADPITARVLFSVWSGDPAVVVPSPPGAGKTRLVALLAAALAHRADLRVGIAAQTREQAVEIARRLGTLTDRAALMWKAKAPAPDSGDTPVVSGQKVRWQGDVGAILIGTTARWLFSDPDRVGADVLIVDESWQCTYADLGALGAMAKQVVCVGDPGQIDPVVTGDVSRWEGSETAPDLPAPIALLAAHGRRGGDGAVGAHLETWPRHHSTDRATVLPRSAVHLEAAPGTPHRFERSRVARIGAPPDHSLRRPVRSGPGDRMRRAGGGTTGSGSGHPPQASGQ